MKRYRTYVLLVTAGLGLVSCGDKKENSDDAETSGGNSGNNETSSVDNEKELKGMITQGLINELFPNAKEAKPHYSSAMNFPILNMQFESDGEHYSISITKGSDKAEDFMLESLAKRYTDGEYITGIGDKAYLNRKLKNMSVIKDGKLFHVSCVKRVKFDEEKTKELAKKLF